MPAGGWLATDRATKEPAELERVAAACAVADRALAALLPRIKPGVTEAELAIDLEWLMRTNGAEALAFDVACLAGPEAALPHGSPGDRPVLDRAVLLFDFGAQVAGYRSDMTRTLFVGEPTARDLTIYELVASAQSAAIAALESGVAAAAAEGAPLPSGREIDRVARNVIGAAGHGEHPGPAGQRRYAAAQMIVALVRAGRRVGVSRTGTRSSAMRLDKILEVTRRPSSRFGSVSASASDEPARRACKKRAPLADAAAARTALGR